MPKTICRLIRYAVLLCAFAATCSANTFHTIPLSIQENTASIITTIDGVSAEYSFDSGTSIALTLSKEMMTKLPSIKYDNVIGHYTDAAGRKNSFRTFTVAHAQAGEYEVVNVRAKEYKPWGIYFRENGEKILADESNTDEEGVIGIGFFQKKDIIIDYPKQTLFVLNNHSLPAQYANIKWISTPLSLSHEGLTIQGVINNKVVKLLLDTGASGCLLRDTAEHPTFSTIETLIISNQPLGPINFWIADYKEPNVDGVLGHDFFRNHVVYLDITNKTVHIH